MSIRFVRWDLVSASESKAVLRLRAGDVLMTDPGGVDCFETALAAAEAAWRLDGPPEGDGSWLELAQEAIGDEAEGILGPSDRPRIVSSQDMAHERIRWLEDHDGLTPPTGEWMLGAISGRADGAPPPGDGKLPAALGPLSGMHTGEWSLIGRAVEAAGPPKAGSPKPVALTPPDGLEQSSEALAGSRTAEWAFAGSAGKPDDTDDGA